ncbi:uncharacterized protein [Narcine bancroftii]|uniref:uncharacterized protein isoform X2 n=1 Tax=Narcine bancroftii TaxID=1343680 RepID=UPI003831DD57
MRISFYLFLQIQIPFAAGHRINYDLQQPDTLTTTKGDSILLNCSYSNSKLLKFQLKWTFRESGTHSEKIIANLSNIKQWVSHFRYCVKHILTLKVFTLIITDVQVRDNGIYNCEMIWMAPAPIFKARGNSTQLNVTASPSIQLLESSNEIASLPSIVITCSAYGFYPNNITLRIQPTCLTNRLISISNPSNPDGTYNNTRTYRISTKSCTKSTEFTCLVQHPASRTEINGTLLIAIHTDAQDHKWSIWISILLSEFKNKREFKLVINH